MNGIYKDPAQDNDETCFYCDGTGCKYCNEMGYISAAEADFNREQTEADERDDSN